MGSTHPDWQFDDRFLEMRSRWFTLIGEHWHDHQGTPLEYWRVERAHSVVIIPIQAGQFLLPPAQFRPGVKHATLDFPGGRLLEGVPADEVAVRILGRELGVKEGAIAQLTPINPNGWIVNSSFSNQQLFGFVAHLTPDVPIPESQIGSTYTVNHQGVQNLLTDLLCLQCRALLLDWWLQTTSTSS
ncbi:MULTISPECIES: NUDIX hydrolase [unclassified Leptolyngbya]|uniref:NUDIX hydrolase n=1 Tax=unclassified Leptolyngbya TaxID=2650499 RepID=UPI0016857F58|nr:MULTISPECIES: NUDIX hydrolase [unclassified Leptolyngbya]MBD1910791.1 NUDIX hydrolase [Leptolyngbya sp. FACHB-8]MBD2158867.1 NUDIX hydrolase [Leptolyngbya sp. FACHB-16]